MSQQIERGIQRECMIQLKAGGWQCIALPHPNSMYIPTRTPVEQELVRRIIHQMKNNGMMVTGAPDLSIHFAHGSALVEIKRPQANDLLRKRPAGRLSPEQAEIRDRATELGVRFVVVRSWEELRGYLEEWGVRRSA